MNTKRLFAVLPLVMSASAIQAQTLDIQLLNMSHGVYFTPIFATAHPKSVDLFESGHSASTSLERMAELGCLLYTSDAADD